MQVLLAENYGTCFGVRDAVALALSDPDPRSLTILGELAHNPDVLRQLRKAGIRTVASVDAPVATPRVMITAHGTADSVRRRLRETGLEVLDATCPLVTHAHRMLERLVAEGYFPIVLGRPDHVEVRGLVRDLPRHRVLSRPEEIEQVPGHPRLGVVSQTTQPLEWALDMVDRIRRARPASEVRFLDTICQPTRDRQLAARRLAEACELVVVVGGRGSHNTLQLARTCERVGTPTRRVECAAELRPEWFDGVGVVGVTAGTSTPEETVAAVTDWLRGA